MNSAKKKLPSLEEELLKNDCDCLCRAVARLLQSSGSGLLSTDVVRQDLASEVENHQSRYIGFFHDEKALHAWKTSGLSISPIDALKARSQLDWSTPHRRRRAASNETRRRGLETEEKNS